MASFVNDTLAAFKKAAAARREANAHYTAAMLRAFDALADPTRRHLVETLAQREASATELASELPITRQAVAKHLVALRDAGLVDSRKSGRETLYQLNPAPLDQAVAWITSVGSEWDTRRAKWPGAQVDVGYDLLAEHDAANPPERSRQTGRRL